MQRSGVTQTDAYFVNWMNLESLTWPSTSIFWRYTGNRGFRLPKFFIFLPVFLTFGTSIHWNKSLHSFKKLSLSYGFLATSPNFLTVRLSYVKRDNFRIGKDVKWQLPGKFFFNQNKRQDKTQNTSNDISHCLNSQKNNLST